jgi:hypothetical protein
VAPFVSVDVNDCRAKPTGDKQLLVSLPIVTHLVDVHILKTDVPPFESESCGSIGIRRRRPTIRLRTSAVVCLLSVPDILGPVPCMRFARQFWNWQSTDTPQLREASLSRKEDNCPSARPQRVPTLANGSIHLQICTPLPVRPRPSVNSVVGPLPE